MMPETQPTYAGYVGWRGMINEWEMPKDLHQSMFDHYFFCLPEGEIMLCFPVPGKNNSINPGERAYNFVWYHPVEEHHELTPWGAMPVRLLIDGLNREEMGAVHNDRIRHP
jgi:hypothetical protein